MVKRDNYGMYEITKIERSLCIICNQIQTNQNSLLLNICVIHVQTQDWMDG